MIHELYEFGSCIGSGSCGSVRLARDKLTEELVAIKSIDKVRMYQKHKTLEPRNEVALHRVCSEHPNIISLYASIEDNTYLHIVLQAIEGQDMYKWIATHKEQVRSDEDYQHITSWMAHLLQALRHVHAQGIIHRDIKAENVLICKHTNQAYLCDFGWSIKSESETSHHCVGTLDYISPQMASDNDDIYTKATDVWSLGILFFELCVGFPPFEHPNIEQTKDNIKSAAMWFPVQHNLRLPLDCMDLIFNMLQRDESDRITIDDCLHHPCITKNIHT